MKTTPVAARLARWNLLWVLLLEAALLAASACKASAPQGQEAPAPAAGDTAPRAAANPPAKQTMTNADMAPTRINELLKKHPATEQLCGEKQSVLSREGTRIVLESAWTKCPGRDRSVAEVADLEPGRSYTELEERYGQARVFIPCREDAACSGRFTRNPDEADWRHLRDEAVLAVDCAPDAAIMGELQTMLREWIEALQAGQ